MTHKGNPSKSRLSIARAGAIILFLGFLASAHAEQTTQDPVERWTPPSKTTPRREGNGSSGGGNYETAPQLLDEAKGSLSKMILDTDLSAFKKMPKEFEDQKWTRESLAQLIAKTRSDQNRTEPVVETGKPRLFFYDHDQDGPYLIALAPYFPSFEGTQKSGFDEARIDIEKRLLHEFAHFLNIGIDPGTDSDAKAFAEYFHQLFSNCPETVSINPALESVWISTPVLRDQTFLIQAFGGKKNPRDRYSPLFPTLCSPYPSTISECAQVKYFAQDPLDSKKSSFDVITDNPRMAYDFETEAAGYRLGGPAGPLLTRQFRGISWASPVARFTNDGKIIVQQLFKAQHPGCQVHGANYTLWQ